MPARTAACSRPPPRATATPSCRCCAPPCPRPASCSKSPAARASILHLARALPALTFQPSDPSPEALAGIAAWTAHAGLLNIRSPLQLDAQAEIWPLAAADAVVCINMIHIAPWAATPGLLRGAAGLLAAGAPLYLYGPFRRAGRELEPSNAAFDESLKTRNPDWGLRELAAVAELAAEAGFGAPRVTEMPANNLSLVFRKR